MHPVLSEGISGCLYRIWERAKNQPIWLCQRPVATAKISDIIKIFHDGPYGGHLVITRTLEKVKQLFY